MIRGARERYRSRRGMMIPLLSVLVVLIVGMLALSVDLGRVAICRAQLQGAADAAALAGASALGTDNLIRPYSPGNQTSDIASARTLAQTFAQANSCDINSSTAITLDKNDDVDVGILVTPSNLSSTFLTTGILPFNSVQVRTAIDSDHGGPMNFFFAPVLHQYSTSIRATATATVELHTISSMKVISGAASPILPITMSLSDWQKMVSGLTGQDNLAFNSSTDQVVSGSDGLQEQQLYPGSNVSSSNNGLIQFGTGSRSNSILSAQIANGPTMEQLTAQWPPSGAPPWNSQHEFTIGADPGWRASDFDALSLALGEVRLIPINDGTPPGNGANGTYTIVMLAPVRVMLSSKGGKNSGYALVQPAVIDDPTLIPSTTLASPGQGGIPVVRLTR